MGGTLSLGICTWEEFLFSYLPVGAQRRLIRMWLCSLFPFPSPSQATLPTYLANPPDHSTLPTYLTNLPYQPTLPTYLTNLPCQPTLPTYLANLPYQSTFPSNLANVPYQPTLPTYLTTLPLFSPHPATPQAFNSVWVCPPAPLPSLLPSTSFL